MQKNLRQRLSWSGILSVVVAASLTVAAAAVPNSGGSGFGGESLPTFNSSSASDNQQSGLQEIPQSDRENAQSGTNTTTTPPAPLTRAPLAHPSAPQGSSEAAPVPDDVADAELEIIGQVAVIPDEVMPITVTVDADGDSVISGGEQVPGSVAVLGEDGEMIPLAGEEVEEAATGDTFVGTIDSTEEGPAEIVEGEILPADTDRPATSPASGRTHSLDVVWYAPKGWSTPSAAVTRNALTGQVGSYWNRQTDGAFAGVTVTQKRLTGTPQYCLSLDADDAWEDWDKAASAYKSGRPTYYYWGSQRRHLVVMVPADICGQAGIGLGTVGSSIDSGGTVWVSVDEGNPASWTGVLAHELGHNLSLQHANELMCRPSVNGRSYDGPNNLKYQGSYGCSEAEYGDAYSVMGATVHNYDEMGLLIENDTVPGPLTPVHKAYLGVFKPGQGMRAVTASGGLTQTFDLQAAGQLSGRRALRITDPKTKEHLFVEYRGYAGAEEGTIYAEYAKRYPQADFSPGVRIIRPQLGDLEGQSNVIPHNRKRVGTVQWYGPNETFETYYSAPNRTPGVSVKVLSTSPTSARVQISFNTKRSDFSKKAAPRITGTLTAGTTVRATGGTTGSWTPTASSVKYQWTRDGKSIAGATKSTYKVVAADRGKRLRVQVTANALGHHPTTVTTPARKVPAVASRVLGTDRWKLSRTVTSRFGKTGGTVYLVNGSKYPDTLSVPAVAARNKASVLLVKATGISSPNLKELKRLRPKKIILVGNTKVLSSKVRTQAGKAVPGAAVSRVNGKDRYDTSLKLLQQNFKKGQLKAVYFVGGTDYMGALVAGPAAARKGGAVVVVPGGKVGAKLTTAISAVKKLGVSEVYVVGSQRNFSTAALRKVRATFPRATRLSGSAGSTLSVAINKTVPSSARRVWIAPSNNFSALLAAATPAGIHSAPVYLSSKGCVPKSVSAALKERTYGIRYIAGSKNFLSSNVYNLKTCK